MGRRVKAGAVSVLESSERARAIGWAIMAEYLASARGLGATIAEYVEDQKILDSLKEIGVDFAQGYQVSKPCLLDDLIR